MSIGQAILALVTLLVATIVYRWQKTIDRETQIQAELRVVYAKYLSAVTGAWLAQPEKDVEYTEDDLRGFSKISAQEQDAYFFRDQIVIMAPDDVVDAVKHCDSLFRQWMIESSNAHERGEEHHSAAKAASSAFLQSRLRLIKVMRASLKKQRGMNMLRDLKFNLRRPAK